MKITNPILRGFHPDPSIVRVGNDYYIATSTFEWWPGIRLHHSTDLVHWELIEYPLNRVSSLDLRGVGASQGIWAPCLTYDDGTFYLVYTVVKAFYCNMYDTNNYLITAKDIHGPWSEPVALNNFGFDPSLFHDADGKKYIVSMVTDHRIPKKYKGRLVLQEYDHERNEMVGPVRDIYQAESVFLEGPHIFRRGEWYYLFSADTGTGEGHGQTIQRSKNVWGPYEMYQPNLGIRTSETEAHSIMTSRHRPDHLLQKSGHGDLVETPDGEWYMVHLCGRALDQRNPVDAKRFPGARRYPLGRETAIQKVEWTEDGWLKLSHGTALPEVQVEAPSGSACIGETKRKGTYRDDFDSRELDLDYQSLRVPMDETFCSLTERPGWLRMYGRAGLASLFEQTLVAKRWTQFRLEADTKVEFEPEVFKQMAGLICMYDTENYYYLHITWDEDLGKCISILTAENKAYAYPVGFQPIEAGKPVYLKGEVDHEKLQFYYGVGEEAYQPIGPVLDASILSDEACDQGWFTGAMVGICCQDLTGFRNYADFDWFTVRGREEGEGAE